MIISMMKNCKNLHFLMAGRYTLLAFEWSQKLTMDFNMMICAGKYLCRVYCFSSEKKRVEICISSSSGMWQPYMENVTALSGNKKLTTGSSL